MLQDSFKETDQRSVRRLLVYYKVLEIKTSYFIDIAAFSLEGVMAMLNLHRWADENTNTTRLYVLQQNLILNIWAWFVREGLLSPCITLMRFGGPQFF